MSLVIKKILEKIKTLDNKTKVEKLTVSNLLQNNWQANGQNNIFKINNIIYINLALRSGTDAKVLTLPEGFRPTSVLMQSLVGNKEDTGHVFVSTNGELKFEYITLPTTNSETFMTSFTFPVD